MMTTMMTRRLVVVAALAAATHARAQPATDQGNADKAAALFDEGKRHFDIGEYTAAIASWKQSYLLSSEPLLLFNIGQAYRLAGNCAQANRFYVNYKRAVPKPANRTELEQAMAVCAGVEPAIGDADDRAPTAADPQHKGESNAAEASHDSKPPHAHASVTHMPSMTSAKPAVDAHASSAESPINVETSASGSDGRTLRITGLAIGGAGAIAGIGAIVSAVQASNKATSISNQSEGTVWSGALNSEYSAGQSAETRARVLAAISGAALVGGGVIWWFGHRAGSTRVDVAITPGHSQVSFTCAF